MNIGSKYRILVVDDEPTVLNMIVKAINRHFRDHPLPLRIEVDSAPTCIEGEHKIDETRADPEGKEFFSLVITDFNLEHRRTAYSLIYKGQTFSPETHFVVMSADLTNKARVQVAANDTETTIPFLEKDGEAHFTKRLVDLILRDIISRNLMPEHETH
jgi:hypothetical protein